MHVKPIAHLPEGFKNSATFQINSVKLYVPVFTLSIYYNIKILERNKASIQKKNFFEQKFISFKNGNIDPKTNFFDKYYI